MVLIKLMVAGTYDVDVLLRKDIQCIFAFRLRRIIEPIAFYFVPGVYKKKIDPLVVGFLTQPLRKGDVVTPVGTK